MDEPSNGIHFIDTVKYEWKPDKICEVDVIITCETADGTPIDCNIIPPYETTDDCTVVGPTLVTV